MTTNTDYDALGRPEYVYRTVEGVVRKTQNKYDAAGRLTEVWSVPLNVKLAAYTYHADSRGQSDGKLESETDANGNRIVYCYDGFNRLSEVRYPAPGTVPGLAPLCNDVASGSLPAGVTHETFFYDANGNVITTTRRDSAAILYAYDNLNRVTSKTVAGTDRSVSYTYDLLGRRLSATLPGTNARFSRRWTYDKVGRVLSATTGTAATGGRTLGYAYDPNGTYMEVTWPEGGSGPNGLKVRYTSDAIGRVTKVEDTTGGGSVLLASYDYDELSRRVRVTRGNATKTSYGYDAQYRLSCLAQDLAGGGSANCSAVRGTGNDVRYAFTYNEAGEIKTRTRDNDLYSWDNNVNVSRDYTVNGLNQYLTAGQTGFTYDGRGNLASDGASKLYTYDQENHLTTIMGPQAATLAYDSVGRLARVASSSLVTDFVYDGNDLVAEYDGNTGALIRRHVHGPGVDEPLVTYEAGARQWIYADERGSVVALADAGGNAQSVESYGAYGEPGLASPQGNVSNGLPPRYESG